MVLFHSNMQNYILDCVEFAGIANPENTVCCPTTCGTQCGGAGCGGAGENCCAGSIAKAAKPCGQNGQNAPCVLVT